MTSWGDGDPNFNKIMVSVFGSDSPEMRKKIYYYVCVIIRGVLYASIFYFYKYRPVIVTIMFLSLVSIYFLSRDLYNGNDGQWWSKKLHLFFSIAIFIYSGFIVFEEARLPGIGIPILLMLDLISGIGLSLRNI